MRGLLFFVAAAGVASAQNAWLKKKVQKEEEEEGSAALGETDFARLNKLVEGLQQQGGASSSVGETASGLLDQAFEQWETLMETPEVKELLSDPEAMKEAIKSNPLMQNLPGVEAMLDSETFADPAKFKEAMHQGIQTFKSVSKDVASEMGAQFQQLLADPEKLQNVVADALGALGLDDPSQLLQHMPSDDGTADFQKQMEQAQQYLATLMEGGPAAAARGGGGASDDLLASLARAAANQDTTTTNARKKRKHNIDLDDQVEIEIPDAINARA
mmetsp:Transcript_20971/g.67559  ORF Transcript_20971/g.67559 Transcript_20971/m.67559 type:complete len:273 (-) Transcript_20971:428-1246(-)